jgi:hypothetical protein
MLKRNFVIIAIAGLALIFSANAFGQDNKKTASVKRVKGEKPLSDSRVNARKPTSKSQRIPRPKLGYTLDGKGTDVNVGEDDFRKPKPRHKLKSAKISRINKRTAKKPKGILPYIEQNNRKKPKARN